MAKKRHQKAGLHKGESPVASQCLQTGRVVDLILYRRTGKVTGQWCDRVERRLKGTLSWCVLGDVAAIAATKGTKVKGLVVDTLSDRLVGVLNKHRSTIKHGSYYLSSSFCPFYFIITHVCISILTYGQQQINRTSSSIVNISVEHMMTSILPYLHKKSLFYITSFSAIFFDKACISIRVKSLFCKMTMTHETLSSFFVTSSKIQVFSWPLWPLLSSTVFTNLPHWFYCVWAYYLPPWSVG